MGHTTSSKDSVEAILNEVVYHELRAMLFAIFQDLHGGFAWTSLGIL